MLKSKTEMQWIHWTTVRHVPEKVKALVSGPSSLEKKDDMQGHERLIEKLNEPLADELTATNQHMVQAHMRHNWKYEP